LPAFAAADDSLLAGCAVPAGLAVAAGLAGLAVAAVLAGLAGLAGAAARLARAGAAGALVAGAAGAAAAAGAAPFDFLVRVGTLIVGRRVRAVCSAAVTAR
jgi:hypothetical protein